MCRLSKTIVLFLCLTVPVFAQHLTPSQLSYLLNAFAAAATNTIYGIWLVDGSVSNSKLAGPVVFVEVDPTFTNSYAYRIGGVLYSNLTNVAVSYESGRFYTNTFRVVSDTIPPTTSSVPISYFGKGP